MSDEVSVAQFLRFCNDEYRLSVQVQRLQDTRQAPQIPIPMIVMGLLAGAALGVQSLRQLDRVLRQPAARWLWGSPRPRVASDSTVARVVGTLEVGAVRDVLQAITQGLRGQGWGMGSWRCPSAGGPGWASGPGGARWMGRALAN